MSSKSLVFVASNHALLAVTLLFHFIISFSSKSIVKWLDLDTCVCVTV